MVKDLLLSDTDALWNFLKTKKFVKTSEIIKWGANNYSNRADRNARNFAREGRLRRLTDEEVMRRFGSIGEGVYEVRN